MPDRFFALGINHECAGVALREPFELSEDQVRLLVERTRERVSAEWMLLTTCNRTELFGYGTPADADRLRDALAGVAGAPWPERAAFARFRTEAVEHVIEVAAGLRSQVLGDIQILNQVKTAYRTAHRFGTVGAHLHKLLHIALATGKRVAAETDLSRGNPSVASLATRVARRIVSRQRSGAVEDPAVAVVLGAGEMGRAIAQILSHDRRVSGAIANRTEAVARDLGRRLGFAVVPWAFRREALAGADVVFVATGSRAYVLEAASMPARTGRPLLVVDVSVPRNVDPALDDVPGYRVLDLDALQAIERREIEAQRAGEEQARTLCREAVEQVLTWDHDQRLLQPAIETLADAFETIREQEVARNIHRIDPQYHEQVDLLTRSIMQKLLAVPVVRLKTAGAGDDELERQVACLSSLFGRERCEE